MYLTQIREPYSNISDPEVVDDVLTIKGFEYIFNNILTVALAFAGIVLFILIIVSGFKFITAGGEPPKIEAARKTLTSALAGIVFIVLSYLILRMIQIFTGVDITTFFVTR
jgi:hypothetical protein